MIFEFAKATDITRYAFENFDHIYEKGFYKKIFITPDTNDYHILRIVEGFNKDYEISKGTFLVEWQKISKDRGSMIRSEKDLAAVLDEDDGSNWDVKEFFSLKACLEEIDGSFGFTEPFCTP